MLFHAQPGIHQGKNSTYKKQGNTSVQDQDQDNGNELYAAHTGIHNIIMDNSHYGPVIDPGGLVYQIISFFVVTAQETSGRNILNILFQVSYLSFCHIRIVI